MHSLRTHLTRLPAWLGALLLSCLAGAAAAQEAVDPPGRVATLSERQGSVVFAPQGEDEWIELPANRPLTAGDRLWSDRGARAELHLGPATVHMDAETHLGFSELDERAAQFMLQQGTVSARVREVAPGENFEIGTPNVAVRALQPGEFRIDVDTQTKQTRVVVHSGMVAVFGEGGQSVHLGAHQQALFAGRFLAQSSAPSFVQDEFGRWAEQRNRQEDQSITARYVPRGVVGYPQLDAYGSWNHDATYGAVWYPTVTVANWAPYRYGHWSWVQPWGWTWVDDAPWGFAPFHYGRWTMIGTRWAWVPGRMQPRPVYAPALVVFMGGGSGHFSIGSGPGVGWYPLAPGEAWYPWYRTSPRYVSHANVNINLNAWPRHATHHQWRQRPFAATAVREDDFRRGRPVERTWQPVQPHMWGGAQVGVVPARPERGRGDRDRGAGVQRLNGSPPVAVVPERRVWGVRGDMRGDVPPAVREQYRAQREQDRLQWEAEREARQQMRRQEDPRWQQDQQWRTQRDAGGVTTFEQQRNAGRTGTFRDQRNAGSVGTMQDQRDAGRVTMPPLQRQADRGGDGHRWQGRSQEPRMVREAQPVPVQRHDATPISREERGQGRWQRGGDEGRGDRGGRGGDRGGRGGQGWGHRQ